MAPSRAPFICARCTRTLNNRPTTNTTCSFATATSSTTKPPRKRSAAPPSRTPSEQQQLPRWRQTPPRMQMPIRLRPVPKQPVWRVNAEQEPLDQMYDKFVGNCGRAALDLGGGSKKGRDLLDEEVKWLAVTHKSFDHARQGFNDRLAFLGKRIVDVQTNTALLNAPETPGPKPPKEEVFQHESLEGLENVTNFAKNSILDRSRLAKLAVSYGVDKVVRWKPKKSDNLVGSGIDTVLAHTMYSIIGALALQRGGEVAAKTVRERILGPLGLKY